MQPRHTLIPINGLALEITDQRLSQQPLTHLEVHVTVEDLGLGAHSLGLLRRPFAAARRRRAAAAAIARVAARLAKACASKEASKRPAKFGVGRRGEREWGVAVPRLRVKPSVRQGHICDGAYVIVHACVRVCVCVRVRELCLPVLDTCLEVLSARDRAPCPALRRGRRPL